MSNFSAVGNSYACGSGSRTILFVYKYAQGSVVCYAQKARMGIIETVVIKRANILRNTNTGGTYAVSYQDLTNRLWWEWELCTEQEAHLLAIRYLEARQAELYRMLGSCS